MKPPDPFALFWDMAQLEAPVLGYDELARTPRAAREALLGTGLIAPGNTARSLVCEACMEGHAEEVESVTRPNGVTQHFIYCPENGRIEVNPDRLRQWTPRYDVVAGVIAESLGTRGDCRSIIPGRLWDLGRVVAAGHSYHVWVARRLTADLRPHLPGDGASVLFVLGARPRDDLGTAPERVFEVRHLVHIEDGNLCFDADAVRAHLAGCAVTARQECAQAVPPAALQALHAGVRQIIDQTAPLPAAVAAVGRNVDAVLQNTAAIADNARDLRKENAELRELATGGVMKFATRIEADDFRAFAAVMLAGNRSQAARDLGIPQRTFYDRVDSWRGRGADYGRMYRLVEWRKKSARKIKVRLDDSLLGTEVDGETENPETIRDVLAAMRDGDDTRRHDDLLRDILQAIAGQNAGNWQSVRAELVAILREEIPRE